MAAVVSSSKVWAHLSLSVELCYSYEAVKVWRETKFGFNCEATLVFDMDLSKGDKRRNKCRSF